MYKLSEIIEGKNLEYTVFNTVQAKQAGIKSKKLVAISLSNGNEKLQDTEYVKFLQWNITPIESCIWSTTKCRELCYAIKSQRQYESTRDRRRTHFDFSKTSQFVPAMIEEITYQLALAGKKTLLFRIHESGDFFSNEYGRKWVEIANHFKGKNVIFMAYTKSLPIIKQLFKEYGKENINITFKSSIWEDTHKEMVELTKELGLSVFTALTEEQFNLPEYEEYVKCPSSASISSQHCGNCQKCYKMEKNTAIEIH